MSDAVIISVVAMVCVTIGGMGILALFLGRKLKTRLTTDEVVFSTEASNKKRQK
jgi:hypothetical protein